MKKTATIALYMLLFSMVMTGVYAYVIYCQQEVVADNLLRLHIIANSDSPSDQALKAEVKDRLVQEMRREVGGLQSREQAVEYIRNNLHRIKEIAAEELKAHNADYDVKVEVGRFPFPTKLYGNLALPAGTYHAVKVVIGEGKGSNWWCVMFPPLCFVDGKNGIALSKDQQEVLKALDEEEYQVLMESNSMEEVPVRIRFKIVEIINRSRMKIAEVLGYGNK